MDRKQKIVLYGIGLEGERFYFKFRDYFEIEYCVDRNCHRYFHGSWVYGIDEVKEQIKNSFVIIAAIPETYTIIEEILKKIGMEECRDYLWANNVGKKLAILYGNCHMGILCEYLENNVWFTREYMIKTHLVCVEKEDLSEELLFQCSLLIGQDIREGNSYGCLSMDTLIKTVPKTCKCITVPNLYGYNFFWPQITQERDYCKRHINQEAIDIRYYSDEEKRKISYICNLLSFFGDENIENMHQQGASVEDIVSCIRGGNIYQAEDIRENFEKQMGRIREREQLCDIQIADYIEENYQKHQLFYDKGHPTNLVICEKGRRILHLLNFPLDEVCPVKNNLDMGELFIYGCVKKALGITYEQTFIRRNHKQTLGHRANDLKEYVQDYIAWVFGQ